MAMRPWPLLLLLPLSTLAETSAEQALILNEEMAYLMQMAPKAQVFAAPDAGPSGRPRRSGQAPSQMDGVDRSEERIFSDEVSFQAAASDTITPEQDESRDYDEEAAEDYRVDGTAPRRSR